MSSHDIFLRQMRRLYELVSELEDQRDVRQASSVLSDIDFYVDSLYQDIEKRDDLIHEAGDAISRLMCLLPQAMLIRPRNLSEIKDWCSKNFAGEYEIIKQPDNMIIIMNDNDKVMFKLRWSDEIL